MNMHFKLHGLSRKEHLYHAKSDNCYYFWQYVQEYKQDFSPSTDGKMPIHFNVAVWHSQERINYLAI